MTAHPSISESEPRPRRKPVAETTHRALDGSLIDVTRFNDGTYLVASTSPTYGAARMFVSADAARALADAIVDLELTDPTPPPTNQAGG